jgi:GGDEF domain-containing protein
MRASPRPPLADSPITKNIDMLREPETTRPGKPQGEELHGGARGLPAPLPRLTAHEVDALIFGGEPGGAPLSLSARVERMLAQCRRQRGVMALVCVRVDRIASPGGELPDVLRRQVCADLAHRMRTRVRGSDLVVREGDLEAGVLMAGASDAAAQCVERRFAQALSGPYRVGDRLVEVAVRVGRAVYPEDGTLGSELVAQARGRMEAG